MRTLLTVKQQTEFLANNYHLAHINKAFPLFVGHGWTSSVIEINELSK